MPDVFLKPSRRPWLGTCRVCGISDYGHPGSSLFTGSLHEYKKVRLRDILLYWAERFAA